MREEIYWYSQKETQASSQLNESLTADAVVVGGGIAGLSAAQYLCEEAGLDVVLLEAKICGAGATGKSSGFITPDSELELFALARRFGNDDARFLWQAADGGCRQIRENIERFEIDCDFIEADSLFVANGEKAFAAVREEHDAHQRLGFDSELCEPDALGQLIGSTGFNGGIRSGGTFGINAFAYAQGLKEALIKKGVRVFENSPVVSIEKNSVQTASGNVSANYVFVCLDKFAPELGITKSENYHAQTFIVVSEPLTDDIKKSLFPEKPMLVWDTDLIYQYFRLTGDGRLLIGGSLLRETFQRETSHHSDAIDHIVSYIRRKFPLLETVEFEQYWAGLIGVTKDLLPLAGRSPDEPAHFYAMCSAGLPWSTLAGRVAARKAIEGETEFDRFFAPDRAFNFFEPLQPIISKPVTFALSHYYTKNYQQGTADKVAPRRDFALAGLCLVGAAAGFGAARLLNKKRTKGGKE